MGHLSTDFVFDGVHGAYQESSSVNPKNYYGEHKALAEVYLQEQSSDTLITRLSVQLSHTDQSAFNQFLTKSMMEGLSIEVFKNEIRNFTFAESTVKALLQLKDEKGIWHVASKASWSREDLANYIKKQINSISQIKCIGVDQFNFKAYRPSNLSMNTDKLQAFLGQEISLENDLNQ